MNNLIKQGVRFCKKHSNEILTGVELVGLGATAYFSAKGGAEASRKEKRSEKIKAYIPAAVTLMATGATILVNGHINKKQKSALVAAYVGLDQSMRKFKSKMTKEEIAEVENKVAEDSLKEFQEKNKPEQLYFPNGEPIPEGQGKLFYDRLTDQWFHSTYEEMHKARAHILEYFTTEGICPVSEFYSVLGLPCDSDLDVVGWDIDGSEIWDYEYPVVNFIHWCEDPEHNEVEHEEIFFEFYPHLLPI